MATKRKRVSRQIQRAVPLTPGQENYLASGEWDDFSAFTICQHRDDEENRKEFEAIRREYKPGAFPFAEREFGPFED